MNKSDSIKNLSAALVKVQAALMPVKRNAVNPFYDSRYADLAACVTHATPLLTANGLAVSQPPGHSDKDGEIAIETVLMHESGEWLSGTCSVRPSKSDPQGAGSAISYLRRYGFCSIIGMALEGEDDDGNKASTPSTPSISEQVKLVMGEPPPTKKPETDDQKKARFLGFFKSYEIYATEVFRRDGLILDTEDYTDISAGKVASFTNNMVNALIKDVKNEAGAAENPELPEEEQLPVSIGNTIVPIPHKGQKRDDYLRKPDTIGSLYVAASDDREAANRLFGFMNNFQPKPWKDKFGKERPPGKSDIEFRAALDALARWREEKGIK